MPKIPDEEIQRLKREVSLVRLCERYGIDLKPQGKNLVGFCPWHKDDKPSFIVTPEKNLWHCMGACDEGGDVFNLVQKAENVSFRRSVDILLEISGSMPKSQVIKTHTGTKHQILVNPDDGYRVPMTTADGKRLKARLNKIGIFRKSGHEHMSGSVVVPDYGFER